jgi:hypothetical protein
LVQLNDYEFWCLIALQVRQLTLLLELLQVQHLHSYENGLAS